MVWSAAGYTVARGEDKKPEPAKEITHHLPRLSSVFPQGAQPGTRTVVKVLGEFLDRASAVVANDPAVRGRIIGGSYTFAEVELEVLPEAAFGPHYFRLVTPRGASNVLIFRVGDLPHRFEHEPNSTFETAEEVALPVTINGRLDRESDCDFFQFHAEKGQSLVFDLRAARNGNGFDAALILLDAQHHELEHSDDYFYWDPFFAHTFAASGTYRVVVQPTDSADPNLSYQLDIRSSPHLQTISPLRLQPGSTVEATLFGAAILDGQAKLWFDQPGFQGELLEARNTSARLKIQVPNDAREGAHSLALLTAGGRSDNVTFLVDSLPAHRSGESITLPVSITGTARYRQPDRFLFDAKADQTIEVEVRAQRFGSPVDSVIRLLDDHGETLVENDDASFPEFQANKDSALTYKFKKGGRYELQMRNLWALDGENYPYELLVQNAVPRAELTLESDQPYVYAGGGGALKVKIARKGGFEGAVNVKVSGLPDGVTADPLQIPPMDSEGEIHLHGLATAKGFGEIRVTSPEAIQAAGRAVTITSDGGSASTIARFEGGVLAVAEKPLYDLEPGLTTVNLVRGRSVEIPVDIRRDPAFTGDVVFSFENLPPGVTADPASVPASATTAKIRLHAAPEAPIGKYAHVVVLGTNTSKRVEPAPQIFVSVE